MIGVLTGNFVFNRYLERIERLSLAIQKFGSMETAGDIERRLRERGLENLRRRDMERRLK